MVSVGHSLKQRPPFRVTSRCSQFLTNPERISWSQCICMFARCLSVMTKSKLSTFTYVDTEGWYQSFVVCVRCSKFLSRDLSSLKLEEVLMLYQLCILGNFSMKYFPKISQFIYCGRQINSHYELIVVTYANTRTFINYTTSVQNTQKHSALQISSNLTQTSVDQLNRLEYSRKCITCDQECSFGTQ
jgi:hypothetical protein